MEEENMKMMKKVLMILAVTALVLSMAGCVAADVQKVNNSTLMSSSGKWNSNAVVVKLDLENDFTVTIPDSFVLTARSVVV